MKTVRMIVCFALLLVGAWTWAGEKEEEPAFDEHYYRHEISLGYGGMIFLRSGATKSYVNDVERDFHGYITSGWYGNGEEGGPLEESKGLFSASGGTAWSVDYYYHLSRRIAVGGYLGIARSDAMLGINHRDSVLDYKQYVGLDQTKDYYKYVHRWERGNVNVRSYFVMPSLKWYWTNLPWCSFYMKGTAGLNIQHLWMDAEGESAERADDYTRNSVCWAWAVVPFGWEIGHKHARGFMELGTGSSRLYARIGLTYRFKTF